MPTRWVLPLAGAVVVLPAGVRAGSGGESVRWWCSEEGGVQVCHENEYCYVESCILLVIVCLALLFEFAHHAVIHRLDHTYSYGKLQDLGAEFHESRYFTPLFKKWFSRLSGELMVLGFIAFLIFIFREVQGFVWLADSLPAGTSSPHLPPTAGEWLHMVELVHMKLFLGMIIYFSLVYWVVVGSVRKMAAWEELRILRRTSGNIEQTPTARTSFTKYDRWRSYFILDAMHWRERRPWVYQETLKRLGADGSEDLTPKQFMELLDSHFAFSAYLAYSVCEVALDTIDVNRVTWCCVLVLFVAFALLHIYAKLIILHFMPAFIVAAFLLLLGLHVFLRRARARVESTGSSLARKQGTWVESPGAGASHVVDFNLSGTLRSEVSPDREVMSPGARTQGTSEAPVDKASSGDSQLPETFHEKFNSELILLRVLQVILFVLSYACARTVGDPTGWKFHPLQVILTCLGFVALFPIIALVLPHLIPHFAAIMALPPYFDKSNAEVFLQVLDDYAMGGICTSGGSPSAAIASKRRREPRELMERCKEEEGPNLHRIHSRLDTAIEMLNEQQRVLSGNSAQAPKAPLAAGDGDPCAVCPPEGAPPLLPRSATLDVPSISGQITLLRREFQRLEQMLEERPPPAVQAAAPDAPGPTLNAPEH